MELIIGIGDYIVSDNSGDVIKTFALASCVAVTAYSRSHGAAGMIHISLPEPSGYNNALIKQGHYATTGIPILLEMLARRYGCRPEELEIRLYGGAQSIRENDVFKIGKRNIDMACEVLEKLGVRYQLEEVGGYISRTIELDVASGRVLMSTQPIKI